MSHVSVTLNGRVYALRTQAGEVDRLIELADHVRGKIDQLLKEFGNVGDDRLLLMAALLIADELWDARAALGQSSSGQTTAGQSGDRKAALAAHDQPKAADATATSKTAQRRS